MFAKLPLIDFPSPSYLSPSFWGAPRRRFTFISTALSSVAASSHCRSSRKSASGCSGRTKTPRTAGTPAGDGLVPAAAKLLDRRLLSDEEFQFGDNVNHEPPVRVQIWRTASPSCILACSASLFAAPRHPYARALLSSVPVQDPDFRQERLVLNGEIPSPAMLTPDPGCAAAARSPRRFAPSRFPGAMWPRATTFSFGLVA